jgi:hypothetical protein
MSGDGRWKLHLPHNYRHLVTAGIDGKPGIYESRSIDTALFDMISDPHETNNILRDQPLIADSLIHIAGVHKNKFYSNEK